MLYLKYLFVYSFSIPNKYNSAKVKTTLGEEEVKTTLDSNDAMKLYY